LGRRPYLVEERIELGGDGLSVALVVPTHDMQDLLDRLAVKFAIAKGG
jgi:hypothetical protein